MGEPRLAILTGLRCGRYTRSTTSRCAQRTRVRQSRGCPLTSGSRATPERDNLSIGDAPGKRSAPQAPAAFDVRAHTAIGDPDETIAPYRSRPLHGLARCRGARLPQPRPNPENDGREADQHLAQTEHDAEQRASVALRGEGQPEPGPHRVPAGVL